MDEVWRLQRGKDAESQHFQVMANEGHYGGRGGTRQGIYILTADGTFLASSNSLNPKKALATFAKGLEKWEIVAPEQRKLPAGWSIQRKRWEDSLPRDALIVRAYNADLGEGAQRERLNRDHLWITKEEARGFLAGDPAVGSVHEVSPLLTQRLTRFHLVDNVRGQTLPFANEDVAGTKLTTTVTRREGSELVFVLTGSVVSKTDGTWLMGESDWTPKEKFPRGVTAQLRGHGRFDTASGTFTALRFAATGTRTGRTNLNGRPKDDVGPAGIGWAFELVPQRASTRIAPAFVDVYNADWIVDPRQP